MGVSTGVSVSPTTGVSVGAGVALGVGTASSGTSGQPIGLLLILTKAS